MGPLHGLRIVEIAGIGPGPFCAMLLADMGAEVLRIERPAKVSSGDARFDLLSRGRRCIAIDLKQPDGVATVLRLVEKADGLLEGFRPGVMERLGARARRLPRAQSPARLRTHDGLRPDRSARAGRRARHQLHRAGGRA
jgi:crotonobetainyl-CoA:carnitine CoA-transferase CaiB-like acyl-CoA transferase